MIDLAENDLQRIALQRLSQRAVALREGLAKLSEQFATRTELLRNTIDANQAASHRRHRRSVGARCASASRTRRRRSTAR